MIDGVKLMCNLNPCDWTNNKNLSFRSWTDTETGEVANNNKHANIKGLHLSIVEGGKDVFCNARGSLPLYFTGGETNAIDYHFRDFLTTMELLNDQLKISPEKAVLRGFEFGVNIFLPFDTVKVYECIKSYKMHSFSQYEEKGKRMGIVFNLQQYRIKIYDKEMQFTGKASRLMRFEIAVKKMSWVKNLGIKTLSDLKNDAVWTELSKILLNTWNEIIFIDKSLQYKIMKAYHQKKYLRFMDISYWGGLNKNIYYKAKNDLSKFQSLYEGKENTKQLIADLIGEKCLKLASDTPCKNGDYLTGTGPLKSTLENPEIKQHQKKQNRRLFNHLNKGLPKGNNSTSIHIDSIPLYNTLKTDHITTKNYIERRHEEKDTSQNITLQKNITPKKIKCVNCKKTIKEKKRPAKFCSLKCKNQYNGKLRTARSRRTKQQEIKNLGKILQTLPKTDISLLIVYQSADGMIYVDHLQQSEIRTSLAWIRQIKKVTIENSISKVVQVEFTTIRAKKLIREITKLNTESISR